MERTGYPTEHSKKSVMRDFLANRLLASIVDGICFKLGMPRENAAAGPYTLGEKADAIISWCEANGQMAELENQISNSAPNFQIIADTAVSTQVGVAVNPADKANKVSPEHPEKAAMELFLAGAPVGRVGTICLFLKMPHEYQLAGAYAP